MKDRAAAKNGAARRRRLPLQPNLNAKYDQLIAAGEPAKLAITRKFIVLANALVRDNHRGQPRA